MKGKSIRRQFFYVFITGLSVHFSAAMGAEDCPFTKIYPSLDKAYHECNNGYLNGSCESFVKNLAILLPNYNCHRGADHSYTIPAIWLAGAAAEDFYDMLYALASTKKMFTDKGYKSAREAAKKLFLSDEFRAVLDGDVAEDFIPRITAMEKVKTKDQ